MTLWVILISFILILATGASIGVGLALSSAIVLYAIIDMPLIVVVQRMFTSVDSFSFMAVPFFILAGGFMGEGGISRRLLDTAALLVGRMTGGLGLVTVAACMFFAAISGSGPATVSAIGSFMIPAMKEKKYDEGFAAALTAAAGSIGVIIPPSIPFVIYCVIAGTSVADLFIAGIIPGIIIGLALMITSYFIAKKHGYPKSEKKQNCSLHIISHQNSASSALVKEKMIFLTSAVRLNAVKLLAFPMKNSCFRKMPQRKWF